MHGRPVVNPTAYHASSWGPTPGSLPPPRPTSRIFAACARPAARRRSAPATPPSPTCWPPSAGTQAQGLLHRRARRPGRGPPRLRPLRRRPTAPRRSPRGPAPRTRRRRGQGHHRRRLADGRGRPGQPLLGPLRPRPRHELPRLRPARRGRRRPPRQARDHPPRRQRGRLRALASSGRAPSPVTPASAWASTSPAPSPTAPPSPTPRISPSCSPPTPATAWPASRPPATPPPWPPSAPPSRRRWASTSRATAARPSSDPCLVQTLFYGVFSAWVLWHRERPDRVDRFEWERAVRYLRAPVLRALFHQLSDPGRLRPLGLIELLDWTGAALDRVDRDAFFTRFR